MTKVTELSETGIKSSVIPSSIYLLRLMNVTLDYINNIVRQVLKYIHNQESLEGEDFDVDCGEEEESEKEDEEEGGVYDEGEAVEDELDRIDGNKSDGRKEGTKQDSKRLNVINQSHRFSKFSKQQSQLKVQNKGPRQPVAEKRRTGSSAFQNQDPPKKTISNKQQGMEILEPVGHPADGSKNHINTIVDNTLNEKLYENTEDGLDRGEMAERDISEEESSDGYESDENKVFASFVKENIVLPNIDFIPEEEKKDIFPLKVDYVPDAVFIDYIDDFHESYSPANLFPDPDDSEESEDSDSDDEMYDRSYKKTYK